MAMLYAPYECPGSIDLLLRLGCNTKRRLSFTANLCCKGQYTNKTQLNGVAPPQALSTPAPVERTAPPGGLWHQSGRPAVAAKNELVYEPRRAADVAPPLHRSALCPLTLQR